MVSLYNGSSRVCLGALDRVAVAEGVEDLEDGVLGHLENLLHLDALQGNDPSWSLFIPVDRNKKNTKSRVTSPKILKTLADIIKRQKCMGHRERCKLKRFFVRGTDTGYR